MGYLDPAEGALREGKRQAAVANLTNSTTGTADGTVTPVSATPTKAEIDNNFAELTVKVNAMLAALRAAGVITT